MPVFLMKCPSCGKHFEVHRTAEKVEREEELVTVEHQQEAMTPMVSRKVANEAMVDTSLLPTEETTVRAEKDTIEDDYVCKHCGHTWREESVKYKAKDGGSVKGRIVSEGTP